MSPIPLIFPQEWGIKGVDVDTSPEDVTKQEKREKRKRKQKDKMTQHGKGIAKIYEDAVRKRAREEKPDDESD